MQPEITVAAISGVRGLSARAEAHRAFKAYLPSPEEIGGPPEAAGAALLRLQGGVQSR